MDGGNAYYVRGGNLGGNVVTLDGVPIYGSGHLFGLSTAYSPDIVGDVDFFVGGFRGEDDNLTASHIRINSVVAPQKGEKGSVSLSPFISGLTGWSRKMDDRLTINYCVRVSPLQLGWWAWKGVNNSMEKDIVIGSASVLDNFKIWASDAYGKATYMADSQTTVHFTVFHSLDTYRYTYTHQVENNETLTTSDARWQNLILSIRVDKTSGDTKHRVGASVNRFNTSQGQQIGVWETTNILAVRSNIIELEAQYTGFRKDGRGGELSWGGKWRLAGYNPGSAMNISGKSLLLPKVSLQLDHWLLTSSVMAFVQKEWSREEDWNLRAMARLSEAIFKDWNVSGAQLLLPQPEASLSFRKRLLRGLWVEGTADYLTQYNHTLEGIPMGWSVDMIIPSSRQWRPEHALQFYAGAHYREGVHALTAGAYWKRMWNLVYYPDATAMFSSAMGNWAEKIVSGDGWSRGLEFSYEYEARRLHGRLSYTLSKTDRRFEGVNDGNRFPAKFDRRHILNVNADWLIREGERTDIGLTGLFTYQSGNMETVPIGAAPGYDADGKEAVWIRVFGSLNNYRMPALIRLDLGLYFQFRKNERPRTLTLGVYNVLNRHNPFQVLYDSTREQWQQVYLFPIMPNISYKVAF